MGPSDIALQEERLEKLLEARFEDLKFADTKSGAMMTLAFALAGVVAAVYDMKGAGERAPQVIHLHADHTTVFKPADDEPTDAAWYVEKASMVFAGAGFLMALASVYCAVRALQPRRTGDEEIKHTNPGDGLLPGKNPFAGPPERRDACDGKNNLLGTVDVAAFDSPEDYLKHFLNRRHYYLRVMATDAMRMARISYVKHRWLNRSVRCFFWEAVAFTFFLFLSVLPG